MRGHPDSALVAYACNVREAFKTLWEKVNWNHLGMGLKFGPAENRKGFMIQHKDPTSVGWWSWCLWSFDPSPCLIVHPSITQCIRNHLRSNLYINVYSIFAAMIYHPVYLFGSFQSHWSSRRWHALKPNGAHELGSWGWSSWSLLLLRTLPSLRNHGPNGGCRGWNMWNHFLWPFLVCVKNIGVCLVHQWN